MLHNCAAVSTKGDVHACVESISIDPGTIDYLVVNDAKCSQIIEHFDNQVLKETVVTLINITEPYGEKENDSRVYIHQVGRIFWASSVSPELMDLMTFNVLHLVKRTQQISLDVRTFNTCGNSSWETLLLDAFAPDNGHGFVTSFQSNYQTFYSLVLSSGLPVFALLGMSSMVLVFSVIVNITSPNDPPADNSHRRPGSLSLILATTTSMDVVFFALYVAYIVFGAISYYTNLDGLSSLFLNRHVLSPFSSNALSLVSLAVFSPIASMLLMIKESRGTSPWTRICTACTTTMTTVLVYHSPFILAMLIEDFLSAFTFLLIRTTVFSSAYMVAPLVALYAKPTNRIRCSLYVIVIWTVAMSIYTFIIIQAKEWFNGDRVYTASQSWMAIVLFWTVLPWSFFFALLAPAFCRRPRFL